MSDAFGQTKSRKRRQNSIRRKFSIDACLRTAVAAGYVDPRRYPYKVVETLRSPSAPMKALQGDKEPSVRAVSGRRELRFSVRLSSL